MAKVLAVATSGLKPDYGEDRMHERYSRVDYLELAQFIDLDIINYTLYDQIPIGNWLRKMETRLRSDLYLTLHALLKRGHYNTVITLSERAGIPFAFFNRLLPQRVRHVTVFTAWSDRQEAMIRRLHLLKDIDEIVVKSSAQRRMFVDKLGANPDRIHVLPLGLDHNFFYPQPDKQQESGFILSLGEARGRDYATLAEAMKGVSAHLHILAGGTWFAREKDTSVEAKLPANVVMESRVSQSALRDWYARSQFVVIPLYDKCYAAGSTSILEAMCTARAVITTRSAGVSDYVRDGETALVVPPGDVPAMCNAINYLLQNPAEARRLGENGRRLAEQHLNMDRYVADLAGVLTGDRAPVHAGA